MELMQIEINTIYIEVDKLLKLANIASSGGEAHMLITEGLVQLNGQTISEKRKKIYPGSIIIINNNYKITVIKEHEA